MGTDVFFDGDELELVESGKLVFVGVVCYNTANGTLEVLLSSARPAEETKAILSKYMRNATLKNGG